MVVRITTDSSAILLHISTKLASVNRLSIFSFQFTHFRVHSHIDLDTKIAATVSVLWR